MTAHISAYGRLAADPESGESRDGRPWAAARMIVTLPIPYGAGEDAERPTLLLGAIVFGERKADDLARHRKGDSLSVAGRLEMRPYTDRNGVPRDGWTVIADSVIGPRTGRPGGKRAAAPAGRRKAAPRRRYAPPAEDMPNDEIPF